MPVRSPAGVVTRLAREGRGGRPADGLSTVALLACEPARIMTDEASPAFAQRTLRPDHTRDALQAWAWPWCRPSLFDFPVVFI